MLDDHQLLRRYATEKSEAAFSELVARHINLVHSTALRRTNGNAHLAQDVAQLVFNDLARKARDLPENTVLAGWLHRATRYAAAQSLRTERRRQMREQEAAAMNALEPEANPDWNQIRPLLDEALDRLNPTDRDVVLLRFFEQRSLMEVGRAIDANEDAARKRVHRALDKLRIALAKRGITASAALAPLISAHAVQTAPAGLAATLTTASLAGAGTGTFTFLNMITATKLKLSLAVLIVAGGATVFVLQQQAQSNLRGENAALQQLLRQLESDNESLSNRLTSLSTAQQLSKDQFIELLKLRGEVGRLRNQAGVLSPENLALSKSPADPETNSPGPMEIHIKSRFISVPKGTLAGFQSFLGSSPSGQNGFTGILNNENFTNLVAQIDKTDGTEVLAEPEVTTSSGRQTQMRATDILPLVTKMVLKENADTNSIVPQTENIEIGPVLDVIPQILSDGRTITLLAIASVTDFLGYAPTNSVPAYTKSGQRIDLPQVCPQFQIRTNSASVNLNDGQTLVLRLSDTQVPTDALPQTLDDPNMKLRQSDTLVLVTATIVDSTDHRKFEH